mmetsp:Transcript_32819/g.44992  ORF Transcript_32819/g.44992 Transcript_32819/m.44992 type:complete len:118 (+) Transcript_32819:174-527(+)
MRNMTQNSPHLLSTTAGVSGRNLTLPPQDFIRCDIGRKGHLDEYEAMILMEDREIVITAPELREMIQSADLICSHKLIFIEAHTLRNPTRDCHSMKIKMPEMQQYLPLRLLAMPLRS